MIRRPCVDYGLSIRIWRWTSRWEGTFSKFRACTRDDLAGFHNVIRSIKQYWGIHVVLSRRFHYQPEDFIAAIYLNLCSNAQLSIGGHLVLILACVPDMKFILENCGRWRIEGAVHFNLFPRVFHRKTVLKENVHRFNADLHARSTGVGEDELTADRGGTDGWCEGWFCYR